MASVVQQILKQDKPFSSLEAEVFVGLQVAANRALDPWARFLRQEAGLTPNQYNVLRILRGASPAGLTCGQIAERMITRDPDVTRLSDRLVRDGLARRSRSAADRRVVEVSITQAGQDVLARLDRGAPATTIASLGAARQRALLDLLEEIIHASDDVRSGEDPHQTPSLP